MFICEYCENEFEPKRFKAGDRQRFCCGTCKNEFHKKVKRDKNKQRQLQKLNTCCHCNNDFIVRRRSDEKYCSNDCKIEYHKEKARIASAKKRASELRLCKLCEKEFSPKRTMKEIYCSKRCRELIPKRTYQMLRRCLKLTKQSKLHHTHEELGYSPSELQEHVTSHPNWEDIKNDKWHLDHIMPIVAFLDHGIKDMKVICELRNLQPLLGDENHRKNGKYNKEEFKEWISKNNI